MARARQRVDVIFLTKDSASRLDPGVFLRVLLSVKQNVPVARMIVVDGFSRDDTVKDVKETFQDVAVIQSNALRGKARELGIREVETDWFMFVDDDAVLSEGWFEAASRYIKPDVGLIWGYDHPANPHVQNRIRFMQKLRRLSTADLMIRNFRIRGGTHDALVRTEAVRDIRIPEELHIYEDAYIKRYVEWKGYRALAVTDAFCYHHSKPSWDLRKGFQIAGIELKYGYLHYHTAFYIFRNFLLGIPKSVGIGVYTGDWVAAREQFDLYHYMLKGYLMAKRAGIKRIDREKLFKKTSERTRG